ncbi:hypothetical protein [Helicobacter felis]|uniref:hypothetical protein n=1 Tax=Helicobacter felis TaxID=214 RepID=UPI000CF05CAE|nr:hypothetical protein [Helicobacter felis]
MLQLLLIALLGIPLTLGLIALMSSLPYMVVFIVCLVLIGLIGGVVAMFKANIGEHGFWKGAMRSIFGLILLALIVYSFVACGGPFCILALLDTIQHL